MGVKQTSFRKRLLPASISTCLVTSLGALAQDNPAVMEEVLVTGVRAAQESAINTKRDAATVVDGIVAEDIGKLPDVTIADSLQRISGVQIRRAAGEGSSVNVRGLPQVVTQLNGEQYLGAGSVVNVQPNFGDIPSQLFRGAEVYKSTTADLTTAGISGTINLLTFRPFDLEEGLTASGSVEMQTGEETGETDPVVSGLVNYKSENFGVLLTGAYANVNLANYYNGVNTGTPGEAGWVNGVNDWGTANQAYNSISSQGWVAWNQVTERERYGLNASMQADLGNGLELVADAFYTNQDEFNRKVGVSATNRWQDLNWFVPLQTRRTGATKGASGTVSNEWITYQAADLDVLRLKSFTQNDVYFNTSQNFNVELRYDNGGSFAGAVRAVLSKARQERRHGYNEGDMSSWAGDTRFRLNPFYPEEVCAANADQNPTQVGGGGCFLSPNPEGYLTDPRLSIDFSGDHPHWSGFDEEIPVGWGDGTATIAAHMANIEGYAVGAYSSENNFDAEGDLKVLRFDGTQSLGDGFFKSVDLGLRMAQRSADYETYHLFSPFYPGVSDEDPEGCLAQWKAVDVALASDLCAVGETVGSEFQPYTALPPTELYDHNNVIWVDDFGPVTGVPGVWAVDPSDYDDPEAFHNRVFGATQRVTVPGSSYGVELAENTFYLQGNFEEGVITGNVGLRIVDTTLTVKQNDAGHILPHGNTNTDIGDILTKRSYIDLLPSVNINLELAENLNLRLATSRTMTPLNLNQWGESLVINTSINNIPEDEVPDGVFTVSSANQNGNPQLNPWRATNFDASIEWYPGTASLLSAGFFYIDIDSFTQSSTYPADLPDSDGVVRRTTNVAYQVQGESGAVRGVELGAKLALLDFIDVPVLQDFGLDANYTYSPSTQSGVDVYGDRLSFPENSENQVNLVLWYEADRFQARIAYNYRDDRLAATGITSAGLPLYQAPTHYLDISASYDINDNVTAYLSGSNVTGEYENYYLQWEEQYAFQNYYEPRYSLGVRARF